MAYTKRVETRQQRYERDNLLSAIEEVTGVEREYWETTRSKERTLVRIRRIYMYLLKTVLNYPDRHVVEITSKIATKGTAQNQISRAMKIIREEIEAQGPLSKEIEAIKKNYEARPPYNFDTVA